MTPLLLVIPYCNKDAHQAKDVLVWMRELHPKGYQHPCLVAADSTVPMATQREIVDLAKSLFTTTEVLQIPVPQDKQGWIPGSNTMFRQVAQSLGEFCRLPWLWFEPDCVPLKPQWLDALAMMYAMQPRQFMGSLVTQNTQQDMPPVHLAGCAIYDPQAAKGMVKFADSTTVAFDIGAAAFTTLRATNTKLMQHFWGQPDLAPTFRKTKGPGDPVNTIPMGYLRPEAVMWHRCKDGSLIKLLREQMAEEPKRPRGRPPKTPQIDLIPPAYEFQ